MAIAPKRAVRTHPISLRIPEDFLGQLDEYVRFLGGATDRTYVIVESVLQQIRADRRFQASRRDAGNVSSLAAAGEAPRQ